MVLFERDSAKDLFCRGFSQSEILDMIGVDVGYCGCKIRSDLSGIDKLQYRIDFVVSTVSRSAFLDMLRDYGAGKLVVVDIFKACGLPGKARIRFEDLCERMDALPEFEAAKVGARAAQVVKSQATMLDRYGYATTLASPELREKGRKTMLERYGADSPVRSPEIRAKMRVRSFEKYGVAHPLSAPEVVEKRRKTVQEKYGVDCTFQDPECQAKQRATMVERYGAPFTFSSPELMEKVKATMRLHYGVEYPSFSDEIRGRMVDTMMEHYGVPYSLSSPELRAKAVSTMLIRYGASNYNCTDECKQRVAKTCRLRYGVDNPMQCADVRDKACSTMRVRYGVDYALQNKDILKKVRISKLEHGTFGTSQPEEALYARLVAVFGADDVFRQFYSDVYPFACDFYVKSRSMYIELNGFVTHGKHWFGASDSDKSRLEACHAMGKPVCGYNDDTWTISDAKKRETAKRNNLNYVVFWGDEGQDVDLWFAMGCPDGRDWDRMYSWLSERDLCYDGDWPAELKVQGRSIPAAARMANWREFYKRELALWDLNYDNKWGTVQARLYANRFKYIGKLPDELTNREILRGLNISGMVRAYSHFDNSGMVEFLQDYDIKSLYDPCAGWGERMLTCMVSGVEYAGTDINRASVDAHMLLLDKYREYAFGNAYVALGDSAERDMTSGTHEAVFTCPPYGDREIYTELGAENLDPDAFLDWWRRVVEHSVSGTTRAFAYQIDQVWKDRMNAVVESLGWRLDRQIPVGRNRVSHMTRSRGDGTKHNFEEVQVFVR